MNYCLWVLVIMALMVSVNVGQAEAVGYERHDATAVARCETDKAKQVCPTVWGSLRQLPYVEKIPDAIDGAVSAFKDILGQFGLNLNGKP